MNEIQAKLRLLQKEIDETERALQSERYDFSDDAAAQKIADRIDAVFEERLNSFRGYDKGGNAEARNDREYLVLKRIKQAIANNAEDFTANYADAYPELSIADELIRLCAPCAAPTFHELNKVYDIELAAAIWILDALLDNNTYEEAAAYFPHDREELDAVYLPNLNDAVHSDDALRSVICLIRSRNRGAQGYDKNKAFIDEAETGFRADPADAELPDRKNFDAVIALIDPDSIEEVRGRFLAYMGELSDELFRLIALRRDKLKALTESTRASLAERQQRAQAVSPLAQNGDNEFEQATVSISDITRAAASEEAAIERLTETLKKERTDAERFYTMVRMLPAYAAGKLRDDSDTALFADFNAPQITCPYEMCFAFLSLLDSNSDEAWLYNLSYGVLALACQALPWADSGAVDPDNDLEEISVDYEYLASLVEKTPDWDDNRTNEIMYRKQLHSPLATPNRQLISISQLAFLASGLIPPRRGNSISFTKAILHDAGLPPEQIALLYEYYALAYSINHKDEGYVALGDDAQDDADAADSENAAEELKDLRAELKRLKKAMHLFERRSKEAESRLDDANKKLDAANRELAELRTMIREASDADENTEVTVEFPYAAQKRSVIVGGHATWVKAIKPLLQNVRFIASSEQPNPGVIMNAEVVWIQTNAMGHSGYYKIMDIVRRNHIKVCYFQYASAEKCAEQFALEDAGGEETNAEET